MNSLYPLQDLFWECTLRCNAFCAFCGSRCGEVSCDELTTEEILTAFQDVAAKMDPCSIMINVTGGEPLLRKDLFQVMGECVKLGFSWGMVTNGILLTPEIVEKLRDAGMKTVSISLDGLEDTHNALRGVKNGFQKSLAGIRMLREADFLEHIMVTTVVSKKNIDQLEQLYDLLLTLGIDSWRVAMVDPIGRAGGQEDLLLGKEELDRYLDFIASHGSAALPVTTSCSHYLGSRDHALGRERFVCRTGKNVASILANGDIFVCPNVPRRPELVQGNVKRDSLAEVWETGFRYFRDPDVRRAENCKTCPDWLKCRGDSMHTWNFDENCPNFCYRRFFPAAAHGPCLEDIPPKLKPAHPQLWGIRISYGQEAEQVVFTPNAARELHQFFRWGQEHPANLSEQLACLIGHPLADGILVEFVAPAYLEARNSLEAAFTETSLHSAVVETNAINLHYAASSLCLIEKPCKLLGFVHSHPTGLDLGMSEPDVLLHTHLLEQGLTLSMIVNPQRRQLAAYCGKDMQLARLLLLMDQAELEDWSFPELEGSQ